MAFASQGDLRRKRVKSADVVSIRTGENIATAGHTHEKLPSAIAQTEEIDVSEKTLQYLSENIGKYWRAVGTKLNLTDGQLDILDKDYSSNHQEKVYQMLLVWKRGIAATYDVLADALKSAGGADLLREITRNPFGQHVATNLKEMKEDTKEVRETQTSLSDRREFEEGSVTSSDEVPIHTGDSHSLRAESMIGKDGGTLDIQNTGASLKIPYGALRRDYLIQMRIIPHHYLDETEYSFASNSSLVVELLPNDVKLLKPAILTLPHCLVLKKICGWKAKVYSSHHEEGNQPKWEEDVNTHCDVTYENCVMRLHNFCWKKVKFDGHKVKAIKIKLFAAKRSHDENEIFLDIGYYWDLPGCQEVLKLNHAIVLHHKSALFFKQRQFPLTVLLQNVLPPWTCNEEHYAKMIKFSTVANIEADFCTFHLKKAVSDEKGGCSCFFKAGQGEDLADLKFSTKESRTEAITPSSWNATAGDTEEISASDESLRDLSVELSDCWKDVGRNLQLTEGQLESLEGKGYVTLKEKIYQMLLVWKRKRGRAATYDVLGDALQKADRVDLQEYLLTTYKPT